MQKSHSIIIFLLLVPLILLLLYSALYWNSNLEKNLNTASSIATILSLALVPIVYFLQKWDGDKRERTQASSNLYRELKDTREALDPEIYPQSTMSIGIDSDTKYFLMNRTLNHDFYDSLISSGKLNFLRPELQQLVQNIFNQIKTHNKYLDLVLAMSDNSSSDVLPKKTYKYYKWLDSAEKRLLRDIPIMLKKLEKDFNI